ncbi:nucleotidyl transferase AbiEii/AbiGii toxin family protein [Streptomyces sp. NA04227]|uniref:nucleotidyl transferase AbiEii/AbiGii toxin family protein n=1 Tax=Streptomyces sp. NA04227 TaxID=2742136 RepID=UPI00158FF7B3|nr:nucleotidyl transferase AbiEii/AbiGii toxin family protein [Streptomyces sp. NA04227]QKW06322.1 nucleotidyl transferase AbiEii/AbiGii toxin family protein [Streptomyces sp. NA04227]
MDTGEWRTGASSTADPRTEDAWNAWNAWNSRPLADRHHLTALAITLHSLRQALGPDNWYLKGSAALTAWIGPSARLPNDLDLALGAEAGRELLASAALPSGPRGESLTVTRHEPVVFSSGSAPTVYRALVSITGPEKLPPVLLGLLLTPEALARSSARTVPLDFPGPTGAVTVPSVSGYRFLTEKLLRYTRRRSGGRVNTHWWDLSDMLLAVAHPAFPALELTAMRQDLVADMTDRGLVPPARLPAPPAEWLDFWDTATFVDRLPFGRLPEAADRLSRFWERVLRSPEPAARDDVNSVGSVWSSQAWAWTPA